MLPPLRAFLKACKLAVMIIATVIQTGGVGKSIIPVHLLTWFREQNIETALVDADVQGSSSEWAKEIDASTPIYRLQSADEILDKVKFLSEKVVIIDGPAGLGEVTRSILLVADIALIPCGPSVLDIRPACFGESPELADHDPMVSYIKKSNSHFTKFSMIAARKVMTGKYVPDPEIIIVPAKLVVTGSIAAVTRK